MPWLTRSRSSRGIRQRTGTQSDAHALVASFLGATAVHAHGLQALGWVALVALVAGLVIAAVLLAPWKLEFAVNAGKLYRERRKSGECQCCPGCSES
jgi:hypothetical protein